MAEKYLLATPHGWYFRRAVPKTLQSVLGKTVLKKPLHTGSLSEARSKAILLLAETETIFRQCRRESMSEIRYKQLMVDGVTFTASGEPVLTGVKFDSNNIEAEKEALKAVVDVIRGDVVTSKSDDLKLSEAIRSFSSEKQSSGNWTGKTKDEIEAALMLVLEIFGDQPIKSLKRDDVISLRNILVRLPVHRTKNPLYRGKSVAQILQMKAPAECLSTASVNKTLTRASALWEWAVQQHYVPANIFALTHLRTGKTSRELRDRFSAEDVKLVLDGVDEKDVTKYWITRIAAYSGMRLNEICQLDVDDIVCVNGVNAFNINDDGNGKKLKTLSSRRQVPVHHKLIYLGFLKYVQKMEERGHVKLFPSLKLTKNGYGDAISKWFSRYRQKLGIAKDGPDFHSFRHTVADSLKQLNVGMPYIEDILGHSNSGSKKSTTANTYTNQYALGTLQYELDKLEY